MDLINHNLMGAAMMHTAKNTILFIGDGMGITTTAAARILDGQMKGKSGEENDYVLSWECFRGRVWPRLRALIHRGQIRRPLRQPCILRGIKTNGGRLLKYQ